MFSPLILEYQIFPSDFSPCAKPKSRACVIILSEILKYWNVFNHVKKRSTQTCSPQHNQRTDQAGRYTYQLDYPNLCAYNSCTYDAQIHMQHWWLLNPFSFWIGTCWEQASDLCIDRKPIRHLRNSHSSNAFLCCNCSQGHRILPSSLSILSFPGVSGSPAFFTGRRNVITVAGSELSEPMRPPCPQVRPSARALRV